jgi:hypothetical protein
MPKIRHLSSREKEFIDNNWTVMSDEDIAAKLGRHRLTIENYRKKNQLRKGPRGSVAVNKKMDKEQKAEYSHSDTDKKKQMWKARLLTSGRYMKLKEGLSKKDLDFFVDQWGEYHLQFEDMTASEEDVLETLICFRIAMYQMQRSEKEITEYQDSLERQLKNKGLLDPENAEEMQIITMIQQQTQLQMQLLKEKRETAEKIDRCLQSLNATRKQREESQKIGAEKFFDLVKEMNNAERRKEAEKYTEYMKKATKNSMSNFKKPHKFMDGDIEPIILDGSDFKDNNNAGNDNGD